MFTSLLDVAGNYKKGFKLVEDCSLREVVFHRFLSASNSSSVTTGFSLPMAFTFFARRQLNGHFLRSSNSTSPYVSCPNNNLPCLITDPVSGISDSITILESKAKS